MSIFDPLGLLCPVTIKGKILMQRIWRSGIGWDDVLLERDYAKWVDYLDETRANTRTRPSPIGARYDRRHGTSRARRRQVTSCANKVMSIPRLELQAALLACRLATNIKGARIATERRVLWCDSKTVLRWIRSDPRAYKPFVAHRLAELDERSDRNEWRWVLLVDPPGAYVRPVLYIRRLRKQQQPFGADDVIDAETRLLRASQRAFSDEMRAAAVGAGTRSSLRALDVMLTDDWLHCKHHPGKILDHETQTDGEEWPTPAACVEFDAHSRSRRRWPTSREGLAFRQRPFTHTGVDYFGPLEVTVGRRREKVGGVIHVSDDALSIWSQNSRARLEIEERMSDEATTRAIRWLRIPHAPYGRKLGTPGQVHKGGFGATLHTRAPKTKYYTLLLEAEFVVNSRPLTRISVLPVTHWIISCWGQPPADNSRDISTPLKNVPENGGEQVRRSQRCSGRDGCENTSHAAETSQVDGEATDQSLPRDRRASAVVDIRTAHGRLRRPTARLAVLPTEVESSRSDRGGLLTAELRPPALRPPIS
ncbi:hypothetical protein EVAR_46061_1 [Eumeta japonica]|uniref:Uncharacterized protein n=1 Tax=Eumeta variegata TaxID=151549 RepID=A0A4C1SLL0_EUMVA|nr:hypothetical protein EVAR_46061_1 [Eumeta japonica]